MFKMFRGTTSIQRRLAVILLGVSIPLILALYYVQNLSTATITRHVEEINAMRIAETAGGIRDILNRIFMATNMFISDKQMIRALDTEDPFDIEKLYTYYNVIDRLQYVFFLNERYAVGIRDRYGNTYVSDLSRVELSKPLVESLLQSRPEDPTLTIMDSFRWSLVTFRTAKGEDKTFILLRRMLFNPDTAGRLGMAVMLVPFAYIEELLARQEGVFEIAGGDGNPLFATPPAPAERTGEVTEYLLSPSDWTLRYWKQNELVEKQLYWFRVSTYFAIGVVIVLLVVLSAFVLNEIRKVLLQIRALSRQLVQQHPSADLGAGIRTDQRIAELSQTLQQLVHNLNTARKNYEAAAHEKKKLEMQILQQQINPHFLLNTLNTFRWMADARNQRRLGSLLLALSHLLRQQIYHDHSHWTVDEEIEYLTRYIEIQRARYGEAFEVSIAADPSCRGRMILKMLVQPLVENCFEHAFHGRSRGVVRIAFRAEEGGGMRITVEDDGVGFGGAAAPRKDRQSIGLDNVQSRLRLHYGEEARLETENMPGGGARVTIVIPGSEPAHEHPDRG